MNSNKEIEFKEFMDAEINPHDNFYGYAVGGWQKKHPLKGEYSRYGVFDDINETARLRVKEMIENLGQTPEAQKKDTIEQKINDIYQLGMDIDRRNKEGASPIMNDLKHAMEIDSDNLDDFLKWYRKKFNGGLFSLGVGPDPVDSNMNILHVSEIGLMLGDRDYYLEENENNTRILNAYHHYVLRIMGLAGFSKERAELAWQHIIELETEIAKHKKTREERRDPQLHHNWMSLDEFNSRYPNIKINDSLEALDIKDLEGLNVGSIKYFDFLNEFMAKPNSEKLQSYFIIDIISDAATCLSEDFYDAVFQLFSRAMSGTEEKRPLWKRVMAIPNSMFGEAVGQIYVNNYFSSESKEYMKGLVENLRNSLKEHIQSLEWMSDQTKQKALDKLASMTVKIGYPDKWKDYSEIHIDPSKSYLENVIEASQWVLYDNLSKLGKPVDKEEWFMTPQTVNAYYSPTVNEICFPAGILQSPFFDPEVDDEINYGAIGVVIGHEMTHGFDDQGRQYDKYGNLNNWWTDEDVERFKTLTSKLVDQFNAVEVSPGVHANGQFTLGENIADQGGIRIALSALINSKKNNSNFKLNKVDYTGFTPLQKFFLAYAHVWAGNIRPEEILERTKSDSHSLSINRVNETLRNITPFLDAFEIKNGDKMFRDEKERVVIW